MLLHHLPYLRQKQIVLASQSPRRAEILRLMGLPFKVHKSSFAEDLKKDSFSTPNSYARATASEKARDVHRELRRGEDGDSGAVDLVMGADTIVVLDGEILEKPGSEAEAMNMLRALSGRQHTVITGCCLIAGNGRAQESVREFDISTDVWFDDVGDEALQAYVRSSEPMDKAGAYGIQGLGGALVSRIDGCYFTVMGLPMHAVAKEIRKLVDDGLL